MREVQALKKEISRLASIPESNPNPIIEVDLKDRITYANPAAKLLFRGFEEKGVSHVLFRDWRKILSRLSFSTNCIYTREIEVEGRVYHQSFFCSPDRDAIRILLIDISERKRMEEELRDSENRFHGIASAALDAVILIDNEGNVTFWNDAAAGMFGFTSEEIAGKELHALIMPKHRMDEYRRGFERFRVTGEGRFIGRVYEISAVRRDGTEFPVELSLSPLKLKGKWNAIGIVRDITERKRLEEDLRKRNEELGELNKELEAFSYSVAHDLRAPLRVMEGFSNILLREEHHGNLDEEGRDFLHRIRQSAQKMDVIINNLLRLFKIIRQDLSIEEIDLSSIVEESAREVRDFGDPRRQVDFIIEQGVIVRADRNLIMIAMQNLIGNAWKFTAPVSLARIEFGRMVKDGRSVFFIRDNGVGFDMTHLGRLFVPFQRLHSESEFPGTGIGLATVLKIVKRMGGKIWAEGELGKGAVFYFTLGSQE